MPTGRSELTSQIHENKIYCIGGEGTNGVLDKLEIYDVIGNTWSYGTNMYIKKSNLTSCIYNNNIYCIGGYTGTSYLKQIEIYNIINNTWSYGLNIPIGGNITSQIYNNKIYCIGGDYKDNNILSLPYISYDITLPSSIQNKLDCINNTGIGNKILSDKGEYIDIPKGYRFMNNDEVIDFIKILDEI